MAQAYKIEEVKKIKARLEDAKSIVLVDYKGINIDEVNQLRGRMRDGGCEYFVSKNTLIKLALNELGISELDSNLVGSTAVAVSKTDEVSPARELANFKKDVMSDKKFPSFKMGYVSGTVMDATELDRLAKLPTKDQLLSMVLQGFNAPMTGFVGTLSGIIRKFVFAVDAIAKKQAEEN